MHSFVSFERVIGGVPEKRLASLLCSHKRVNVER
jgi:hypothetical protein